MSFSANRRSVLQHASALATLAAVTKTARFAQAAEVYDEDYWGLVRRQFIFPETAVPMNCANLCPSFQAVADKVAALTRVVDYDVSFNNRAQFNDTLKTSRAKSRRPDRRRARRGRARPQHLGGQQRHHQRPRLQGGRRDRHLGAEPRHQQPGMGHPGQAFRPEDHPGRGTAHARECRAGGGALRQGMHRPHQGPHLHRGLQCQRPEAAGEGAGGDGPPARHPLPRGRRPELGRSRPQHARHRLRFVRRQRPQVVHGAEGGGHPLRPRRAGAGNLAEHHRLHRRHQGRAGAPKRPQVRDAGAAGRRRDRRLGRYRRPPRARSGRNGSRPASPSWPRS